MKSDSRIRSIKKIPVLGKFITRLELNIQRYGAVKTAQLLITNSNTKLKVVCSEETTRILTNNPCVISFNHPYEVETFAVCAALPDRPNIRMIATANLLALAPKLKNHIFPVWIDHHAKRENAGKISGKIAKLFNIRPQLNPERAHLFNIRSIKNAALFVDSGGIVTIAPAGFRGPKGNWFSGIGHLVNQITSPNAYYVACFIKNTSDILDWFRLLSPLGKFLPEIQVYFSKPIKINYLKKTSDNPKNIANHLESKYLDWSNNLSS